MALIVLASATGSPGVTTTALGLAMSWPRPVMLIDADPSGSAAIQAGYFRGADLAHDPTILDLLVSQRDATLTEDLPRMLMTIPDTEVRFLPGLLSHTQAPSMKPVWPALSRQLRSIDGRDVIVDAGRLGLTGSPVPLIYGSNLTVLTTHTTLPALRGAVVWAESMIETAAEQTGVVANLGALVIGPGRPYSVKDVTRTLQLPVITAVSYDPIAAQVLSLGQPLPARRLGQRRWERTGLAKSLTAAASAICSVLDRTATELAVKDPTS